MLSLDGQNTCRERKDPLGGIQEREGADTSRGDPWCEFFAIPSISTATQVSENQRHKPTALSGQWLMGYPQGRSGPRMGLMLSRLEELGHDPTSSFKTLKRAKRNRVEKPEGNTETLSVPK